MTTPASKESGLRQVLKKVGIERLHVGGVPTDITIAHFWQWSASNLLANSLRGHFAEYLVATALNTAGGTRVEWDSADLIWVRGLRIEVKSAAYLQAWKGRCRRIIFDIGPKRSWNWSTNKFGEIGRHSDVYVFCLLAEHDEAKIDPTDLSQWRFYAVTTRAIDYAFPTQKSLSLPRLEGLNVGWVSHSELAAKIENLVTSQSE